MKKALTFLAIPVLASFLALAVFGFLGLIFSTGFAQCAASVIPSGSCQPAAGGSAQVEIFHTFSLAILTILTLLITALAWLPAFGFARAVVPALVERGALALSHSRSFRFRQLVWMQLIERASQIA